MAITRIIGGKIYDPTNGINGIVRDIWMENGKIIAPPVDPDSVIEKVIDATGRIIMAGGVDMHCHIAGPKVNLARKMRPEDKRNARHILKTPLTRSGTVGSVPSTFATGYLYAGMGYTTAFDAAVPPLGARHAHEEFQDTPILDKGFFLLMGNNHYALQQIAAKEPEKLKHFASWLLDSAKGYAIKLVNPGGVEVWKSGGANIHEIDEDIGHFNCTPRQIIQGLTQTAMDIGLPHPVHIHCNNLGLPGNWHTTMATMDALEGRNAHLTHIQFHSYGGEPDDQSKFCSKTIELANFVNSHPEITVDVGQVLFGETTSLTGDGPLGYYLHKVTGRKWTNADTEMEAGCGIVPITYKEKSFVHALQWAIGLEWYLLVKDPWQISMSTDHPNGGSFLAYPEIIQLLMDRNYRNEILQRIHPRVLERTSLKDIPREYTLEEIAIITRAGPARTLGLINKGHLGIGADADVTIYNESPNILAMFELPFFVIKSGKVVVDKGEIRLQVPGNTLYVSPSYDHGFVPGIRKWFESFYTIQFENYAVEDKYLSGDGTLVPCVKK